MPTFTNDVNRHIDVLFQPRSWTDRVAGRDRRQESLERLAESGDVHLVPLLMVLVPEDDALSATAARAIVRLVDGISPSQFAWMDEETRRKSGDYLVYDAWRTLSPKGFTRLIQTRTFDPVVIGLFGSHRNGYVRAAALERLADIVDGREIPFLAVRANDWVPSIAARAEQLLMERMHRENREAIFATLPFLFRTLGSRRRNRDKLREALRSVLLSDDGDEAIRKAASYDTGVRRSLYDLIDTGRADVESRVTKTALNDPDAVIRARALRRLASDGNATEAAAVFERLMHEDPVPAVRRLALSSLSIAAPERMAAVVPPALLDRAARMRAHARSLAAHHKLTVVPRDIYRERLESASTISTRDLAAAIEGIGETGTRADVPPLTPFLQDISAAVRRASLSATATLDIDTAIPHTIAALGDEMRSVRTLAVRLLKLHASRVDFDVVNRRLQTVPDPAARRMLMPLLRAAPKWDAAIYLLEGLTDPHEEVRTAASRWLTAWLNDFNLSQVSPSADQVRRIHQLLDTVGGQLSPDAVKLVQLSVGSL